METISIKATIRTKTGKGMARKLRREGFLPAVIYGGGKPQATHIAIPAKSIKGLKHYHGLINIDVNGETRTCILKEIQYNHLGDQPMHLDFQEITFGETIATVVELEFKGTPVGVTEEGGVLEIMMREMEIETFPRNIPEKIIVDISNMHAGDAIHIKDLKLPEGVKALDDPESTVVVVTEPEATTQGEEESPEEEQQTTE